ncbi:MAG TPA: NAD(P)/FAD-dependent oxidoreductase [Euzebyales bacterium]|nr:NAD(P)/FAD-dependent oxidoreductase [Euzebyales bacterium]
MTTGTWDVVVAGAGHNSLVTAAYLARAGLRCLVLEARDTIGGDTATEELTLPGFRHDSCSTAHNLLQSNPIVRDDELGLLANGGLEYLRPDPVVHLPFPDGSAMTMWRHRAATCASIARLSADDAAAYERLLDRYDEVKGAFAGYRATPIGDGPTLDERLAALPASAGVRWRRLAPRSAWDVIRAEFGDERCRAALLWLAFLTMQPPQRPGTAALAHSLPYGRQRDSWVLPRGGSGALPDALARVITDRGGRILTGHEVRELIVEDGRCTGVVTADGTRFTATRAVLSTVHVKHLVEMAPAAAWGAGFVEGVASWRPGVSMFVTHYATTAPPRFPTGDDVLTPVATGLTTSVERMLRVGPDFEAGRVALDDPVLLVLCPTVADPSRAPAGHHTVKVIGFQPYELPEGPAHWDVIADDVSRANLAHLRRYAPNLTDDVILAAKVSSPLDLERRNAHNWHGSCHGGDMDPSQSGALRPVPGWARHRMPIPGLYQTGATTHPGGSVSGAPGRNAAQVLLDDLGIGFAAAVRG